MIMMKWIIIILNIIIYSHYITGIPRRKSEHQHEHIMIVEVTIYQLELDRKFVYSASYSHRKPGGNGGPTSSSLLAPAAASSSVAASAAAASAAETCCGADAVALKPGGNGGPTSSSSSVAASAAWGRGGPATVKTRRGGGAPTEAAETVPEVAPRFSSLCDSEVSVTFPG